ncbi:unnamed protein product [Allacma fusca]|uniref:CRAL-TRIO domain-containing protein n=1 Tax=Allacma fusca TaxID=39272 RepID=A0A8J2L1A4_9HEXA|nr:unnamed protein product [Allacma fusca]
MGLSRNNSIEANDTEAKIAELRNLSQDILLESKEMNNDFVLLRFLRACDWDIKKAKAMMSNAAKWRVENDVDSLIYKEPPVHLLEKMPIYIDGFTNDGLLVASVEAGKIDFRALLNELGKKQIVEVATQSFAQAEKVLLDQNEKYFKNQRLTKESFMGAIVILDFKGFSYWQLQSLKCVQLSIELCQMMVNYFPDLGSHLICINCNRVSRMFLKIVKPIVESPSLKIEVFGEKQDEWSQVVLANVQADQLRVPFGGSKTEKFVFITPECLIPPHLRNSESAVETC